MRVPFFQVDAFTSQRFAGNPAAVMVLPSFPDDATMQAIAAENNLAETAFLVLQLGQYHLRWFTPTVEVPLCGHATLATAAVIMERLALGLDEVVFQTASGPLPVTRSSDGYVMDFPSRPSDNVPPPHGIAKALGVAPMEVHVNQYNYLAVLDHAKTVRDLAPDFVAIAGLDRPGIIVTAPGDDGYDFVSRYFAPAKGIPEDPVTGAAHCMLAPYWAARLKKTTFHAYQASRRGGEIDCQLVGDRVSLVGHCVFYLEGQAEI
ncbi:PhzF family phenazine biosynthesis protein [Rhizobium leguminosarum]|uniref:PhzF family phenazine biosynthesis protein n=1 Tax=Rhizobium leguminosarum TaxID=384 RepID=UPI003ECD8F2D